MAKPGLTTFNPTDGISTFQTLFNKVNELVAIVQNDVVTATTGGDSTTGNATLVGNFTANIIIGNTAVRTETLASRNTTDTIGVLSPMNINSGGVTPLTLQSTLGPRQSFSNGSVSWFTGFESSVLSNFVIGTGSGAAQFRFLSTGEIQAGALTLTGNASVAGITATSGTLNGVNIGATTAGTGRFTTITATTSLTTPSITATGGTLNGVTIGATTAAAGTFTTGTFAAGAVGTPSITRAGDPNTGMYFPNDDQLAFATGGVQRLFMNSGGIGINTANPLVTANFGTLTLDGTSGSEILLRRNTTNVGGIFAGNPSGNFFVASYGTAAMILQTASTDRVTIDTSGRVGIGAAPIASAILALTSTTSGFRAPAMTTTQRNAIASPVAGLLIYNTTLSVYQVYNGSIWTSVGGGATGTGTDAIFWENDKTITASYTITTNKNAMTAGPVTINDGVTVTVPDGSVWTVV